MIKEYIKDNKKFYRIVNHYIGTIEYNGKEKRINKMGFTSKREAMIYIAKKTAFFEEKEKYNATALNRKITFQELATLWFEQHRLTVRETSRVNISNTLKLINKHFKNCEIKKITLPMAQRLINDIAPLYSRSYLGKIKSTFGAVLDYSIKCDLINKNVMKLVKLPREEVPTTNKENDELFYTKKELQEFLAIVKNNYDLETYLLFRLLAYTGARKGEITALCWSDIDFKNNTLSINKTHSYNEKYRLCINQPKTKTSNRIISLDKDTINILRQFKVSNVIFDIKNHIFQVANVNNINTKLATIYRNYPHLKKITPHGFRHTHASLLFEAGASFKDVQERLGHSDIKLTMNIYTHVTKKQNEQTANNFAKFLSM